MARVLVIDDEPDILAIVEAALEVEGHSVVTSTDPRKAVRLAVEHAVEAVVLDVTMPEMSGFETLESLRADPRTSRLPILFLSALGDSEHRIRGLRHGADDYLGKPFEPPELVLRVERLVTRRHRSGDTEGSAPARVVDALRTGDFRSGEIYFGRYQALAQIGEGAMGVVLRGWDPRLKRPVALKTVRLDKVAFRADSGEALARLLSEATALARFNHPNIVAVYDVGSVPELAFIVLELVDGISLEDRLREGALTDDQAIHLGRAVARALAAAHERRTVHRDIKPGNILLGVDAGIKVTDFGLAAVVSSLTEGNTIYGTPGFVPPETLIGEPYTPAGDVFGLGAVLYACVTGRAAFTGASLTERIASNLACEAPPPHAARPGMPRAVSTLVAEMLSQDPAARPAAGEVERRLSAMAAGEPAWDVAGVRRRARRRPRLSLRDSSGTLIEPGSLGRAQPVDLK